MSQFVQFEDEKKEEQTSIDFKQFLNVFEFETILPGSGEKIKFKPMTTGQLKKLLSYEKNQNLKIIEDVVDNLISECVLTKNFDINDLYLQDRFYLLIKLREKTKGSNYEITWTCPKCNSQILSIIDISKLNVKNKKTDINDIIKVTNELSVKVDIIKRKDQKEIIKYVEQKNKKMSDERKNIEINILSYASSIKSIITPNGEINDVSLKDKIYIIEKSPTSFFDDLRKWHDENDFGIDFTTTLKCNEEECDYEGKMDIPTDTFFF